LRSKFSSLVKKTRHLLKKKKKTMTIELNTLLASGIDSQKIVPITRSKIPRGNTLPASVVGNIFCDNDNDNSLIISAYNHGEVGNWEGGRGPPDRFSSDL
jgi:hypothetical protein